MAKKQKIIILIEYLAILLFLFVIGSGVIVSPLFGDINIIDEGQFGAWVSHMFKGAHLYKDTYAAYGPLYIYPLYILSKLFSPTVFLIRIIYTVLNTFLAVIILRLILHKIKVTHYLELFCVIMLLIIPEFGMRQGIGLLTILLLYQSFEKEQIRLSIATGIALTVAFLTSSDTGIFVGVICFFYFLYQLLKSNNFKHTFLQFLSFIGASTIIFLIFFLWSSHEGWFFSYILSIYTDLTIYSGIALPNGQNFPNAIEMMPHSLSLLKWLKYFFSQQMLLYWLFFLYLISFLYFVIRVLLKKMEKVDSLVLLITIYGFFLSVILIGRSGHFPYTLAPAFILFAYYLHMLREKLKTQSAIKEKIVSSLLILLILTFSIRLISIYRPHFKDALNIPTTIYRNQTTLAYVGPIAISNTQTNMIRTIQTFVSTHTNKDDKIFFLNNEPMMYFLVDRENPTRYDLPEVANTKEKRMEVLTDLINHRPKYIIDDQSAWAVDGISNQKRLPEVMVYINQNYTKTKLNNFIIYRIKK